MKASKIKRFIMLLFALAFIPMVGFSQTNDLKELAKKAATALTESMTDALKLTEEQQESVAACNSAYSLSIFSADPLTDEDKKMFKDTLDESPNKILNEDQYKLWKEKQEDWLNNVEKSRPLEKEIEEIEILEQTDDMEIF